MTRSAPNGIKGRFLTSRAYPFYNNGSETVFKMPHMVFLISSRL